MKLSDLITQASYKGACHSALTKLRKCRTWEDVLAHPDAGHWAVWAWHAKILPTRSLRSAWADYRCDLLVAREIVLACCTADPWTDAERRFAQAVYEELKE